MEGDARIDRLCELNVCQQVKSVGALSAVQRAWRNGEQLSIHGWIYGLADGLIKDLGVSMDNAEQLQRIDQWVD